MQLKIEEVEKGRIPELISYVMQFRRELFPMINNCQLPYDLAHFEACYLEDKQANFLMATNPAGQLVGTIGMRPYDHRFPHLTYPNQATNEVLKLYVEPALRRTGLGTRLVKALKQQALQKGVETLYLHTHPFLTGALEFWQKQGFRLVCQDDDSIFRTQHLDFMLTETQETGTQIKRTGLTFSYA